MAKWEHTLQGNFYQVLSVCHSAILSGSASASLRDGSDISVDEFRVAVRIYERYSIAGSTRMSLNLTLVGHGNNLRLSAIASGGSSGLIFQTNTLGEDAFLSTLRSAVYSRYG